MNLEMEALQFPGLPLVWSGFSLPEPAHKFNDTKMRGNDTSSWLKDDRQRHYSDYS